MHASMLYMHQCAGLCGCVLCIWHRIDYYIVLFVLFFLLFRFVPFLMQLLLLLPLVVLGLVLFFRFIVVADRVFSRFATSRRSIGV